MSPNRRRGWRDGKLEDLVFFQRGFDITQAHQREGAYPVISSSGVTSYHNEFKVKGPGVVIGRKGTLGSIHFTTTEYWPHDTTLWSKDLKGNNPRFVYYFLHTLDFKRFDVGNSNPTLNRNHIHDLTVIIPPLQVQDEITEFLLNYDNLIENNRRRMGLLEEAARQLYREWFVRLRFPGHERVKIKNGLPEGWERKALKNIAPDIRDAVVPCELEPGTPYIGLEHMPRRSITLCEWGTTDQVTSTKLRYLAGDILFGKIRPYFHKVGFALTDGVSSSDSIILRPVAERLHAFVLFTVSSDWFVAVVSKTAKEGSKMPRADWNLMETHEIAVPPSGVLDSFRDVAEPMLAQLKALAFQNQKLRAARDLLSPKLMSGEIAV